uniref:C2H2-type domain-containing protein n=1 Tax=Monopterus albus TaxID=43700 RepID=A0A3Q3IYT6_MONAL
MFYWTKTKSGVSETLDSLGNMSKAEILRGIITEKLTTAAQEILAVVGRTMAGYEEEASGFRKEIDRQRRQLELLQPERRAQIPGLDSHEVVVLSEEEEEEEEHTHQTGAQDAGSQGVLWVDNDEEEQLSVQPEMSSREKREDLKDPDYQMPSRSFPRLQSGRRKPGRPRISDAPSHLDLRVRILEDSQIVVLSSSVFKKYPVQELRCPRGLREVDFLDLLRSTFPQLAANKPFDIFTADRSRRLHPMKVKSLTPEEICRAMRCTGMGNWVLYIRLKTSSEDLHSAQRQDDETIDLPTRGATTSADQSKMSSPTAQPEKRKRGRPRLKEEPTQHYFRICMLEDSSSDVSSKHVLQRSSVQDLKCPRGLHEADFLALLRSTVPQLAGDEPFSIFKCNRSRQLQRLNVKSLTPEEISRTVKGPGALLYVRLKTGKEEEDEDDECDLLLRDYDATDAVVMKSGDARLSSRLSSPTAQPEKRKRGRPRLKEEPTQHYFRICMLKDSSSDVSSKHVLQRSSVQDLKCPRGLHEADFLALLRSTVPQLAGDEPFSIFKCNRSRQLQRLNVKSLTPEEISRTVKGPGALLYVRLKTGKEEEDEDDECDLLLRDYDATDAVVMKSGDARLSSSSLVRCGDGKRVAAPSHHLTLQPDMDTEEADDEGNMASSTDKDDDDDWKPDQTSRKRAPRSTVERSKASCKVCGVWYKIQGSLIKHAWSHVEEPQCACGVCGEHFQAVEEIKTHLRNHQKTFDCLYCGKSFFTAASLNNHTTLHTGNRLFKCDECNKTFAHKYRLRIHSWVHVVEKPYKCDVCPKTFGLKAQLRAHSKMHAGRDKYHCHICGKFVYDLRSLTRHKATHSVERRYGCEICGKRFKVISTLKAHEKIHTVRERPYLCHICCKTFLSNCGLKAHMMTHEGERPFICIVCSKGFISNGERKTHMRIHTGEAPYGCSECGRFFKRKSHLNNHIKCHLGIKQFVCTVCGKACSRQEHLTVHMRTHNGERPYQCTLCDKAFTQSHCLKTHMKSHQGGQR